jgi:hypothetical protein
VDGSDRPEKEAGRIAARQTKRKLLRGTGSAMDLRVWQHSTAETKTPLCTGTPQAYSPIRA